MRLWLVLVAIGACAFGCAPGVDVQRVSPRAVEAGAGEVVRVIGAGFEHTYNTFTGEATASFRVRFGPDFADVEWVDATELRCTVPDTLSPGTYDVRVFVDEAQDVLENGLAVVRASSDQTQ